MNKPVATDALAANIAAAERHLARFRAGTVPHLIAGLAEGASVRSFEDLSPVDHSVIAKVASCAFCTSSRSAMRLSRLAEYSMTIWGKPSSSR